MRALAALSLALSMSGAVFADNATWLNVGGVSKHFSVNWDRPAPENELNPGIGVESEINGLNYMAGVYKNSISQTSRYLVAEKIVYRNSMLGVGFLGGIVNGYRLNDGGIIPAAALTATVEYDRIGVRFAYMPGIKNMSAPVLSMQFRLRLSR